MDNLPFDGPIPIDIVSVWDRGLLIRAYWKQKKWMCCSSIDPFHLDQCAQDCLYLKTDQGINITNRLRHHTIRTPVHPPREHVILQPVVYSSEDLAQLKAQVIAHLESIGTSTSIVKGVIEYFRLYYRQRVAGKWKYEWRCCKSNSKCHIGATAERCIRVINHGIPIPIVFKGRENR